MRTRLTLSLLIGFAACSGLVRGAGNDQGAPALPTVEVGVVSKGPVVDGSLDDPCWAQGGVIGNLAVYGKTAKSDPQTFRILTDGKWLYLGGEIPHPMPVWIKPACLEHDGGVNADDSVEWFVDPGTKGAMYYHFMLNAANVRAEQRMAKGIRERSWNTAWRSATRLTDKGWVMEAAIPMRLLAANGDLNMARMNVCMTRVLPTLDTQGVRVGETRESLMWSPVVGDFHEPDRFGWVKGLDAIEVGEVYLPRFDGVKVGGYDIQGKDVRYVVDARVRNGTAQGGLAEVMVEDHPLVGKGETVAVALQQTGQGVVATNVAVPVSGMGDRWVRVALKVDGEEWESQSFRNIAELRAMRTYLDRNYYTSEKQGWVIGEFGLPEETLKGKVLKVIGESGKILGEGPVAKVSKVGFDLEGLKEGTTKLGVELVEGDKGAICRQEVVCVKRAPKQEGIEWKNDQENRALLRNGQPFFPFGINVIYKGATNFESRLQVIKEMGFNNIWMITIAGIEPTNTVYLDLAKKYDLLVVPWMENYCEPRTNYPGDLGRLHCELGSGIFAHLTTAEKSRFFADEFHYQLPRFLEATRRIKDHPSLLGYFFFDEPFEKKNFDQVTPGREFYRKLIETDGYHPVMVNYSSYIPEGDEYVDWCDMLCTDPYWFPPVSPDPRNTPNWVTKVTVDTWQRADVKRNPIWSILVSEIWTGIHKRPLLPREQRCQTYLALIHGTKAILYFTDPIRHQQTYDVLKELAGQVKALTPALNGPQVRPVITYSTGPMDPVNGRFPEVQYGLFKPAVGDYVLLAANSQYYPVDVGCDLSLLKGGGTIKPIFGGKSPTVQNGQFSETIEPYGVRAYYIAAAAAPTSAVSLNVTLLGSPEKVEPEPAAWPRNNGRVGKRNIMPNPSFEDASLPGWPDYYMRGWIIMPGPLIGSPPPGACLQQDDAQVYHGRYALRLRTMQYINGQWYNEAACRLGPKVEKPTEYTISAWMKADRKGMKAAFIWHAWKQFELSTEWRRYSETFTIQPGTGKGDHMDGVRVYGEGTAWVDAMQYEKGDAPTEFEP